ncbi:MAG: SRPBCC family protein [Solirubrobacteraceae bacterium]
MLVYSATSNGSPQVAWQLMAQPAQWHRWAPHICGARGLGTPEVEKGRSGFVVLASGLPIPVRITDKQPVRSWDWRVGAVNMRHTVQERPGGCEVRVELRAAAAVELALRAGYGPVVGLLVRNLARVTANRT